MSIFSESKRFAWRLFRYVPHNAGRHNSIVKQLDFRVLRHPQKPEKLVFLGDLKIHILGRFNTE